MNLSFLSNVTDSIKDTVTSAVSEQASNLIADLGAPVLEKINIQLPTKSEETDMYSKVSEAEIEDKGNKMLQVMDWAFEKSNGNIPGLGTAQEMAQDYLQKYGSVTDAIDKLIGWQVAASASAGFVTSLGGLATMPITLPANIAGTMAIQMRLIGSIAELAGYHDNTEEKRTAIYLCLLGGEATKTLSSIGSQFAVKFATAQLKRLPGTVLTKINQRVGFRLFTKFGEKGLVNIAKAIPLLGGVVGGSIDAFSTYSIAQAAKAVFLNEIMESEKMERLEMDKIRLLINLARIDNDYAAQEKAIITMIANGMGFSPNAKKAINADINNPRNFDIDFTPFKNDLMLATSTFSGLYNVAKIGGISAVEQIYMNKLANELGLSSQDVALIQSNDVQS